MIDKLIQFSIARRWLVMFLVLVIGALGVWNYQQLPIDAVPDITNVQVQINTEAPGYSPLEVEQRITYLVELAITGLPYVESTRSLSRYALSQVTVVFEKGTDIYFARNLINERLQQAKSEMPSGIEPVMGPVATGLGEIFHYAVHAKPGALQENGEPYDATALRTLQDWVIRPQLRLVPGVTEVNTIGGFEKQFHITPEPAKLLAYQLSFDDLVAALEKNNANIGAGYIEKNGEQYLIRAPGQVADIPAIEKSSSPVVTAYLLPWLTWPRLDSARNCAPVLRHSTVRRQYWVPPSCCWAVIAGRFPRRCRPSCWRSIKRCLKA